MIGLDEIVAIARRNFERAQTSLDADLAATRTPADARLVRDNRDRALAVYIKLLGQTLDRFSGDWEAAATRAKQAAAAIEQGTGQAMAHTDRLRLMAGITASLGDIVKAFG